MICLRSLSTCYNLLEILHQLLLQAAASQQSSPFDSSLNTLLESSLSTSQGLEAMGVVEDNHAGTGGSPPQKDQ